MAVDCNPRRSSHGQQRSSFTIGRGSERNVSIDNIARIARGLKVKAWTLLDDSVK
ncbi:hypothetical protein [Bradyrhizobium sp. URHD0069]|uniref:hypothetical protein n=1 Tax=Bradyrhizobium sp. URHD0069 TaxID=1380355 RepID=UPI000A7D148F|nr:hypothetical protein [Bradyrhizobium sp. URHD0069]